MISVRNAEVLIYQRRFAASAEQILYGIAIHPAVMATLRTTHQKETILRFHITQKFHAELIVSAFRTLLLFDLLLNLWPQILHRLSIIGDDKPMAAVTAKRMNVAGRMGRLATETGPEAGVQAYRTRNLIYDGFYAFQSIHHPYLQKSSYSVESRVLNIPYIYFSE